MFRKCIVKGFSRVFSMCQWIHRDHCDHFTEILIESYRLIPLPRRPNTTHIPFYPQKSTPLNL